MASSPVVRTWLFAIPETICGMAGNDNPGLGSLIVGWTIEFIPAGIVIAWVAQVYAARAAVDRAAAFDNAVTAFHGHEDGEDLEELQDYEAEYE
jgi:hypothetical protein